MVSSYVLYGFGGIPAPRAEHDGHASQTCDAPESHVTRGCDLDEEDFNMYESRGRSALCTQDMTCAGKMRSRQKETDDMYLELLTAGHHFDLLGHLTKALDFCRAKRDNEDDPRKKVLADRTYRQIFDKIVTLPDRAVNASEAFDVVSKIWLEDSVHIDTMNEVRSARLAANDSHSAPMSVEDHVAIEAWKKRYGSGQKRSRMARGLDNAIRKVLKNWGVEWVACFCLWDHDEASASYTEKFAKLSERFPSNPQLAVCVLNHVLLADWAGWGARRNEAGMAQRPVEPRDITAILGEPRKNIQGVRPSLKDLKEECHRLDFPIPDDIVVAHGLTFHPKSGLLTLEFTKGIDVTFHCDYVERFSGVQTTAELKFLSVGRALRLQLRNFTRDANPYRLDWFKQAGNFQFEGQDPRAKWASKWLEFASNADLSKRIIRERSNMDGAPHADDIWDGIASIDQTVSRARSERAAHQLAERESVDEEDTGADPHGSQNIPEQDSQPARRSSRRCTTAAQKRTLEESDDARSWESERSQQVKELKQDGQDWSSPPGCAHVTGRHSATNPLASAKAIR